LGLDDDFGFERQFYGRGDIRRPERRAADGDCAIRAAQDQEFAQAEQDALIRSLQRREERAVAEEARRGEIAADQDCRVAVRLAFEAIGPEPEGGTLIEVKFPPNASARRRFAPSEPGEHIYAWIENEDFMWRDNTLIRFTLKMGITELDREKTLEAQGIRRRCMLQAFEDED
jgi:hypothetical protein